MTKETKEIVTEILQFLGFIALLIFLYFAVCCPKAHADNRQPRKGEWLCWVNSNKDQTCGTYGWHKQKKVALQAAIKKCEEHCEDQCQLDYCEVLK